MLKFKTMLVATVIFSLVLLSFVSYSNAIEIEAMGPRNGSYEATQTYNQYVTHIEYVRTDVAYSRIEWYVDDVLKETSSGDGVKTEATYQPWHLIGSDAGTDYVIKAIAYPWEGDGSDSDSFTLTVILPFQIVDMSPSYGSYDISNYTNWSHTARVRTSEPYYCISWYVDGVYQETSWGDESTTEATFSPYTLSGNLRGEEHEIKAYAYMMGGSSDTDSYTLTVYTSEIYSNTKELGVYGWAELSRQYYSHPYINVDCNVYAYNSSNTDRKRRGSYEFTHEVTGANINETKTEKEEAALGQVIPKGGSYGTHYSNNLSISIENGESGQVYTSNASVKLEARGEILLEGWDGRWRWGRITEEWPVSNSESFTRE